MRESEHDGWLARVRGETERKTDRHRERQKETERHREKRRETGRDRYTQTETAEVKRGGEKCRYRKKSYNKEWNVYSEKIWKIVKRVINRERVINSEQKIDREKE